MNFLDSSKLKIIIDNIYVGPGTFIIPAYPTNRTPEQLLEAFETHHISAEKISVPKDQVIVFAHYDWEGPYEEHYYFSLSKGEGFWQVKEKTWLELRGS